MIKCTECGYENMDGLDYCDGCGAKLKAAAPGAGDSTPSQPAEAPKSESSEAAPQAESKPAEAPASEAPTGEIKPPEPAPAEPAAAQTSAPAAAPSAPAAAYLAKFVVVRGGRKGQEFALEEGNNLIGRWDPETGAFPEVDLDADDPEAKISRKHALLRMEAGKLTIEDIGSLNGTYVNRNGTRLSPGNPVDVKNGDEIIIGKTFLKLVVEPVS